MDNRKVQKIEKINKNTRGFGNNLGMQTSMHDKKSTRFSDVLDMSIKRLKNSMR